ncbi:hypothetical protein PC123_g27660 [Phytophthora cactorum]|nr:hypothetical protein PC120_g27299 [Phytophthora cactorum]KAG4036772.1 hypothetical protein PC123_g27660 [Phytophthora cactorum]
MVEFCAQHASTGLTPFYVNYGRHPRVPALLGVERSVSSNGTGGFDGDGNPDAGLPASRDLASSMHTSGNDGGHDAIGRESAHDTSSALLNGVTTRTAAKTAAQGVRTRAATRAAASLTSDSSAPSVAARATPANTISSAHPGRAATRAAPRAITDWTTRALIDSGLQHRHISGSERQDAVDPAASSFANFEPNPESQQRDAAAVQDFVRKRDADARTWKHLPWEIDFYYPRLRSNLL